MMKRLIGGAAFLLLVLSAPAGADEQPKSVGKK